MLTHPEQYKDPQKNPMAKWVTDQFKRSVDVVWNGTRPGAARRQCAPMSSGRCLWLQVFLGGDHLLGPVGRYAHVTHKVECIVGMTWQAHQLVSLATGPNTTTNDDCSRSQLYTAYQ